MKDVDQSEEELLHDLFNTLDYEENDCLTSNKLILLSKEKLDVDISEEEAENMMKMIGVKNGIFYFYFFYIIYC